KQNGLGYLSNSSAGSFGQGLGNVNAAIRNIDHQPFTQSNFPQVINGSLYSNSSGMIMDASFLRFKSAGVYYTLRLLKKSIKHSKIYLQGQNLFTITDYIGFDPEAPSNGFIVPALRTIVAGIQLT